MLLFAVIGIMVVIQRRRQQEKKVLEAPHGHVPTYAPAPMRPLPSPAPSAPLSAYSLPAPAPYPVPTPHSAPAPYPVTTFHPFDSYSAPATTPGPPIQQPHGDRTAGELNRLHQVNTTMTAVYEQQQHRRSNLIHGEDMSLSEYRLSARAEQ